MLFVGVNETMTNPEADRPVALSTSAHAADDVLALLHAFEEVLQAVYRLPPVVAIPSTYRRRGYRRYIHWLPRPRWFLRFFVVDHAHESLDHTRRRMLARSALGDPQRTGEQNPDRVVDDGKVAKYIDSLPPTRRMQYTTTLLVLTIVLTQFVLVTLPGAAARFGGMRVLQDVDAIDRLLLTLGNTASDFSSVSGLLAELTTAPVRTIAFVVTSLMTVLYALLRPLVPAFRLKRTMFNLYPRPSLLIATPARWSVQRAVGLYQMERSVDRRLRARRRVEVPFDLIVPALLTPSLLFLGGMMVEAGSAARGWVPSEPWLSYTIASAVFTGVCARLAWLLRAWLRRSRAHDGLYLPSEARISPTQLVVALRDPLTILWATLAGGIVCAGLAVAAAAGGAGTTLSNSRFLILAIVVAPLWFRMNRDVSAYLELSGEPRPGRPWLSLLAMIAGGVPTTRGFAVLAITAAAVSVYRTGRRVQRARGIAGCGDGYLLPPSVLAVGFVVFPLALAHIQQAINDVWRHAGDVVDRPDDPLATMPV